MMKKGILLLICSLLTAAFCLAVFLFASNAWRPGRESGAQRLVFSVKPGDSLKDIAGGLERRGLISSSAFFRAYVFLKGFGNSLQAGCYELSASMSMSDILSKFTLGDTVKVRVTIPEGFNLSQVESVLDAELNGPGHCGDDCGKKIVLSDLLARDYEERFGFLRGAPGGATLEGFLFPDTYRFDAGDGREDAVSEMLKNFERKVTPGLVEEMQKRDKSVYEIVTMASIIEKEVGSADKGRVSGILWNRLRLNMPLQADATLAYITGKRSTKFYISETKIDSPYNTYLYRGLPKGPICNPGIESIVAAVYPEKNNYLFYLSTPRGQTVYSRTFQEHIVAKNRYLK